MKRQAKQPKGQVVGFYKDRDGKTKPITKSAADLNRKKLIENGHGFKGVGVVGRVRDVSQQLEDLMAELNLAQDHQVVIQQQQKELAEQGKVSPVLNKEVEKTNEQIRLLKNKIRGLRA